MAIRDIISSAFGRTPLVEVRGADRAVDPVEANPAWRAHTRSAEEQAVADAFAGGYDAVVARAALASKRAEFSTHGVLYACMSLLMQDVAAVPLRHYRDPERQVEINDSPLLEFLKRPNAKHYPDTATYVETIAGFVLASGNVWQWASPVLDSKTRMPESLLVLGSSNVSPMIDSHSGELKAWRVRWGTRVGQLSTDDLDHLKFTNIDDGYQILGAGPVQAARAALDADYMRARYDAVFYERGYAPAFKLRYDPGDNPRLPPRETPETIAKLVRAIKDGHASVEKFSGIIGLNAGWNLETLGVSPSDLNFVALHLASLQDIARVFKIPPPLLGDLSSAGISKEGIEVSERLYARRALVPLLARLQAFLQRSLADKYAPGTYLGFDTDEIAGLKGSYAEKLDQYTKLVDKYVSPRVAAERCDLGLDPKELPEEALVPFNIVPLSQITDPAVAPALQKPATPPPDDAEDDDALDELEPPVEDQRSIDTTSVRYQQWRAFVDKWEPLERQLQRRLKRYFASLRTETLKNLKAVVEGTRAVDDDIRRTLFDEEAANETLRTFVRPFLERAVRIGSEDVADALGLEPIGLDSPEVDGVLRSKVIKVVRINRTVRNELRATLREGFRGGETLTELSSRIRAVFKDRAENGASRSRTIARTEIGQAVNGGKHAEMRAQGVTRHEWMTAGDEHVRESHQHVDGEVRQLGEKFSNGLLHPGDPDGPPEEVIQCRCTSVPVVDRQ